MKHDLSFRAANNWVTIRATVTAKGSGYSSCLGSFDGVKDHCSETVVPGQTRDLEIRARVVDPETFQAKINAFPNAADAQISLELSNITVERAK